MVARRTTSSLFGVQAQRLDVDAGAHSVLEQRNLVDVDGQQVVLRQSDQRQRGAAVGAEHAWRDGCGHVAEPFGMRTYLRIKTGYPDIIDTVL